MNAEMSTLLDIAKSTLGAPLAAGWGYHDWPGLIRAAEWHNCTLVLRKALMENGLFESIDAGCRRRLNEIYARTLTKNEYQILRRWITFHKKLLETDIPCRVVKGPALCWLLYGGDWGMRAFADIDLLVPKDSRREFLSFAAQSGVWQRPQDKVAHLEVPFDYEVLMRGGFLGQMQLGWQGIPLDVKSYAVPFPGIGGEIDFLSKPVVCHFDGVRFLTPDPTVHLALLCYHITKDGVSLSNTYEIARLCHLYKSNIDWSRVCEWRDFWFGPIVGQALSLCERHYGVDMPGDALRQLTARRARRYRLLLPLKLRTRSGYYSRWLMQEVMMLYIYFVVCGGLRDRVRFVWRLFVPPRSAFLPAYRYSWPYARYWAFLTRIAYAIMVRMVHGVLPRRRKKKPSIGLGPEDDNETGGTEGKTSRHCPCEVHT